MPLYWHMGLQVLPETTGDQDVRLLISGGFHGYSKLVIGKMNLETCEYAELASKEIDEQYYAAGIAYVADDTVYQLTQ